MASSKVELKISQPKKDGTLPVVIRITVNRKNKYISTGYSVKANQFKPGLENWITKHPDADLLNLAIEAKRSKIMNQMIKAEMSDTELTVHSFGKQKTYQGTFFSAIAARMEFLKERNQVAMYNRLNAKLAGAKASWGKDFKVSALTPQVVQKYITWRLNNNTKVSTIKKDMTDFSTVLNSIPGYEGKDYFRLASKQLIADPVNREKLTLQEIKSLEDVKLEGLNDIARDMFLFAFYCHGMRFQNVAMFQRSDLDKGVITYRMNKGKKIRQIVVHPKLKAIISKYERSGGPYLFPVIKKEIGDNWDKKTQVYNANALINLRLKRVAVIAGIEKNLSTHIARHSFAYLSLERGVGYEILKDALGHSDYQTTQMYLKSLSDQRINDAVSGLFD